MTLTTENVFTTQEQQSLKPTIERLINEFTPGDNPFIKLASATREDLAKLFFEFGFTVGAEVGVESGRFSKTLLRSNPGLSLLCVDAWKAYRGYRDHVTQSKLDKMLEDTKERLKDYNYTIMRGYSVDIAKQVKNNSLDFVFIDANHAYQFVVADLAAWAPKVRAGGIVSGHDWFHDARGGPFHVIEAVTGWVKSYRIEPVFIFAGDEGKSKSWAYIKK
jgi:hypothetical protein